MAVRVRKDVWKLDIWDPIILWYAKGILKMQSRTIDKSNSWRYQAAIHDYIEGQDPLAEPGDVLPSPGDQTTFWAQCQHGSWFFLPWHRMYLLCFEQIIAAAIVEAGGPPDWALPYWNYSDTSNKNATKLPPAFIADKMPDGTKNPLRVDDRDRGNDGGVVGTPGDVDITRCLRETQFQASPHGGNRGFGGPKTPAMHNGGTIGKLEATPHGSMHIAVGGWMSQFNTAGLDPIFWLHHSNIDRLWSVWRVRDPKDLNPTDPQWLTGVTFKFHDVAGNVVSHTASQVVDTTVAPLFYRYEDESDPLAAAFVPPKVAAVKPQVIPEMVGATANPVTLTHQPSTASFAAGAPTGPAAAFGAQPPEIYLNLENITGEGRPLSYSVYLNVPPGSDPQSHPELYAGELPMFGLPEASRSDRDHDGSGLHYNFDVTEIIRALEAKGDWNPKDIRVTFVPKVPPRRAAAFQAEPPAISVGRISLYYA
jgi:tyrosinase